MNEDFVPFELAEKLKEKGFRWDCFAYYMPHSDELIYNVKPYKGVTLYSFNSLRKELISSDFIDAPTISQALKWLREVNKIHIEFVAAVCGYSYIVSDTPENGGTYRHCSAIEFEGLNDGGTWDKYEEAAIAGIEYCLDNLI